MESWRKITLGFLLLVTVAHTVLGQCRVTKELDPKEERSDLIGKLNGLPAAIRNRRFQADQDGYNYTMQVCPDDDEKGLRIGVLQEKNGKTIAVIGRFNESDVHISGRGDLIMLIYTKGENYSNSCGKNERHAMIVIRCVPGTTNYTFDMLSESSGKGEDFCFYTFELLVPPGQMDHIFSNCGPESTTGSSNRAGGGTVTVAPTTPTASNHHGLSTGSIILILVMVPLLAFFILGSVYKRFVAGAQGWEQVPFIDFWRKCGSLQADGWRYTFGRGRSAQGHNYDEYTAVSTDDERQPTLGNGSNDDHLLPM